MHRFTKMGCWVVVLGLVAGIGLPTTASAQVVQVYYPPPAPVVTYYPPPPTVTYSYYPSSAVFPAPVTSYSAPVAGTPVPIIAAPATTVYSAPTTVYYPSTVTTSGVVTTRSYFGLGIFRPYGWNHQSTYTPTGVQVNPPRVTTYYTPVFVP